MSKFSIEIISSLERHGKVHYVLRKDVNKLCVYVWWARGRGLSHITSFTSHFPCRMMNGHRDEHDSMVLITIHNGFREESGRKGVSGLKQWICTSSTLSTSSIDAYQHIAWFFHSHISTAKMGFSLLFAVACFRSIHSFSPPRIRFFCVFLPQCTTHAWLNVSCVMCVVVESANTCHFRNVNKMNYTTWE